MNEIFLKNYFKKKVKNTTSLRIAWKKYCCSNLIDSSFNNNNTIRK